MVPMSISADDANAAQLVDNNDNISIHPASSVDSQAPMIAQHHPLPPLVTHHHFHTSYYTALQNASATANSVNANIPIAAATIGTPAAAMNDSIGTPLSGIWRVSCNGLGVGLGIPRDFVCQNEELSHHY